MGGLALGIVASRFLKASSSNRYEQRRSQAYGQLPARTTYDTLPATSGIDTDPVTAGPAVPTTPVTPAGRSGLEGSR